MKELLKAPKVVRDIGSFLGEAQTPFPLHIQTFYTRFFRMRWHVPRKLCCFPSATQVRGEAFYGERRCTFIMSTYFPVWAMMQRTTFHGIAGVHLWKSPLSFTEFLHELVQSDHFSSRTGETQHRLDSTHRKAASPFILMRRSD